MPSKYYFYHTQQQNPFETLALEEVFMNHVGEDEMILYLYSHADTVVIGRNQNAWVECRHEQLLGEGGKLARRISGGGAVFHDIGNLNFSFIVGREKYDLHRQLQVILDAVKSFGINAEFSGRNDILADGRKFSGNAFCFRKKGAFHHGTILIGASVDKINKYLAVSKDKIESKGISSVRSRVINLKELNPNVTPELMAQALLQSFSKLYGTPSAPVITPEMKAELAEITQRNASWNWQFGESPAFDITFGTRFPWGNIEFNLSLQDATIQEAKVFSDAMDADFIATLPAQLSGCAFRSDAMVKAISRTPRTADQTSMLNDILNFIQQQNY